MTFFSHFRAARPPLILPLVRLNSSSQFSFSSVISPRDLALSTLFTSQLFSFSTSGRSRFLVFEVGVLLSRIQVLGVGARFINPHPLREIRKLMMCVFN